MRHTRTWLYVFLPFLYLAIVLGFIAFQFSKKTDSFSQSLGDLTISGKAGSAGQAAEMTIRGRGLEFFFDAAHFLQVEAKDGATARLRPLSWAWKDGNVIVSFQQGVQLAFEKNEGGRSLLIHPVDNEALGKLRLIRVPFGPEGGFRLVRGARTTLVEVIKDKTRLMASVDGAQDKVELDNTFVLTSGKKGFRPARIDPIPSGMDAELAWLTLDNAADAAAAESALSLYWDKAYTVWAGATSFSTKLVDAWSREALLRNEYPAAVSKIQALLSRDRKEWGFEAASTLGNLVELTNSQRRAVEAASSRSQPDWAGQGRLWLDARLYGPSGSADRVKELLLGGKLPDSASDLLAFFQNLLRLQAHQPSEAVAARTQEVLRALVSRTVRREGELFVQSSEGLFDLRSGLTLGRLWLDYSRTLSNEPYGVVGAQLVVSALAWADASGRIPEILVTQDGGVVRQEGTVRPEDIYLAVKPAPDQEVGLAAWGPSAFVRTPAKVVSQVISPVTARFTFRFPTGMAEHVIVSGVPAFDHITLHGIRWRTDPQFQSYTDGWYYSASAKTLYVKIKHREDLEELIIHFQQEQ